MQVNDLDVQMLVRALAPQLAECLHAERERLINRSILAVRIGISERGVSGLVSRGELPPGFLIGGVRRWDWGAVLRFLESRRSTRRRRRRGMYDRQPHRRASGMEVAA